MATASLARFLSRYSASAPRAARAAATAVAAVAAGTCYVSGPQAKCSRDDGHGKVGHSHGNMPASWSHKHADGKDRSEHLLLAVPKKGRLHDKVIQMLAGAGIEYKRQERQDIAYCHNLPVSIVFLPASDIATYVGEGDVDLGITGEDVVAESEVQVDMLMPLGFGKCRLSVQAPMGTVASAESLAGARIVTSFPNLTRKFFAQFEQPGKPTHVREISGSVEAACGLGLADGIVDLVETGTTMKAAGLEEVAVVLKTQAVLIGNPHTKHPELCEVVRRRLAGWLTAQSWVLMTYNVHRTNLKNVEKITPGKRSPSVQPLEDKNWVAVAALVPRSDAANVMDRLEAAGAEDILMTGLLSSRMGD